MPPSRSVAANPRRSIDGRALWWTCASLIGARLQTRSPRPLPIGDRPAPVVPGAHDHNGRDRCPVTRARAIPGGRLRPCPRRTTPAAVFVPTPWVVEVCGYRADPVAKSPRYRRRHGPLHVRQDGVFMGFAVAWYFFGMVGTGHPHPTSARARWRRHATDMKRGRPPHAEPACPEGNASPKRP